MRNLQKLWLGFFIGCFLFGPIIGVSFFESLVQFVVHFLTSIATYLTCIRRETKPN